MTVEIKPVGGWGEVGKNMTAVRVDDDVVIFDMGLHLPNYIEATEQEEESFVKVTEARLKKAEAIPDDRIINNWRQDVSAIIVSHAHLDHVGAVPYLAAKYDAPIICTPFTAAILKTICKDEHIDLPNKIIGLKPGKSMKIGSNLRIEFVHTTHSTPQTIIAALHTPDGIIVYGNDYKLDNHPTLGRKPDYNRFKQLGKKGVLALIQDCIYAREHRKTPSELVAKQMLEETLLETDMKGEGIIVTTFASHIARLKTIAELGRKLKRKVYFMSRSIAKYCNAAKTASVCDLTKKAKICKYPNQIKRALREVNKRGKDKCLLVVSGHQGEPQSMLAKMSRGVYDWKFTTHDNVIFSAHTIPSPINQENRARLDASLKQHGCRIFTDLHVSGHSSREDMRTIIDMLKPTHLLPTHGDLGMMSAFNDLAKHMNYERDKTLHPLVNGQTLTLRES